MPEAILEEITVAMKAAMKSGDKDRLRVLRVLLSELKKAEKEGDSDATTVLRRERKKRQESIEAFAQGGRQDLVEKEEFEAAVIAEYLPAEVNDAELERVVDSKVNELNATEMKQMGTVMKAVMAELAGRADGSRVSAAVKKRLSA